VNLWINLLLGDEQRPEDSQSDPKGTPKDWPRWLTEGKSSPSGLLTFTSWQLWKQGDNPAPSGLHGLVRFLSAKQVPAV
jgi:hypothetical protein